MSIMEPGGGQSATQCAEASCLEKEQIDQDNDRHPRHRVPEDDSVSEPAVRPQSVVRHQRTAVQRFGHHERLPGSVPRGGRLANRCRLCFLPKSYFFGSLAITASALRVSITPSSGLWQVALASMNNLVQNNGVTAICCPCSDAALFNKVSRIRQWILFRDFRLCMAASSHAQLINQANSN
jgi:hypothetical protein